MDTEHTAKRHRELVEAGWVWRFTGEEPRVSELSESYEALGLEVLLEPGILGREADCGSCFDAERCTTVYTRGSAKDRGRADDDLFR